MNIHEYQAKDILKKHSILVLPGFVASSVDEAIEVSKKISKDAWAIKAQIHAGGRGLGGGIKIAKSIDEVKAYSQELLNSYLCTNQTDKKGKLIEKIYIEKGVDIYKNFYLSIILDRSSEKPVIIASKEGGVDIESVAKKDPSKIIKIPIDIDSGFLAYHSRSLSAFLDIKDINDRKKFFILVKKLYDIFLNYDAELIEINPLIMTKEGDFFPLDAKMSFDDNALFRHEELQNLRDITQEEPSEVEAKKYGLSYIKLDGNVGCMVNGAGLAMGTMDAIYHSGGKPANFLDVAGSANAKSVAKAFEIILKDKNARSIFINIFGGIVRCDRIADGIVEATKNIKTFIPIVIRLDGTNAKEAMAILKNAKLPNLILANDLEDGAKKAVLAAKDNDVDFNR